MLIVVAVLVGVGVIAMEKANLMLVVAVEFGIVLLNCRYRRGFHHRELRGMHT